MVQFRFSALHQTSFQSAYTTVRFIIIGIIYKSHWYKRSHGKWNLRITLVQREERREKREERREKREWEFLSCSRENVNVHLHNTAQLTFDICLPLPLASSLFSLNS